MRTKHFEFDAVLTYVNKLYAFVNKLEVVCTPL